MFLPFKTILKEYVLIPERIIYTDESDHAGAGYCLQILGKIVHRRWTEEDSRRSSTWRELIAMELTPDAFKVKLQGKCVISSIYGQSKRCKNHRSGKNEQRIM